jgi:hypothetical protein
MDEKRKYLISVVGLVGSFLWVLTIFLRETELAASTGIGFLLGILPNFGIGLLLPMLLILFYPLLFKAEISAGMYRLSLAGFFLLLLVSEIIHDRFLSSPFDIYDLAVSFLALGIMVLLYKEGQQIEKDTEQVSISGKV